MLSRPREDVVAGSTRRSAGSSSAGCRVLARPPTSRQWYGAGQKGWRFAVGLMCYKASETPIASWSVPCQLLLSSARVTAMHVSFAPVPAYQLWDIRRAAACVEGALLQCALLGDLVWLVQLSIACFVRTISTPDGCHVRILYGAGTGGC